MELVYGFVQKYNSLENLATFKADLLAKKIVLRINQGLFGITEDHEHQKNKNNWVNNSIRPMKMKLDSYLKAIFWIPI